MGVTGVQRFALPLPPPVSTAVTGRPWPSARRCTLVENPPWLRPSASRACASPPGGAVPAGAGGVLMGTDDARVPEVQVPIQLPTRIRLGLQRRQGPAPHAG